MLNEALTREEPFPDMKTEKQLIKAVCFDKLRPVLYSAQGKLATGLCSLIVRCWQQEPALRMTFAQITDKLMLFIDTASDITRFGTIRVDMKKVQEGILQMNLLPAIKLATPCIKTLASLSESELSIALEKYGLGTIIQVFQTNRVSRYLLASVDEASDLQESVFGISSKVTAKALYKKILEWKENGVEM
jgi:hypothetical protein